MSDLLHPFVFEHAAVRGELVRLDAAWRAVLERHAYPAPLRRLLGELMAAAALLSASVKMEGTLTIQIQGSGTVRLLVVECASDLSMRAMARWEGEIRDASVSDLIGDGRFAITLDPAGSEQRYQGVVALDGTSVAEILEHYMARSEQLATRFRLEADESGAAGMMLQRMPGLRGDDADAWNRIQCLGATATGRELLELPAEKLIARLFPDEDVRLFEPRRIEFRCPCSRERVGNMLRLIGHDEVRGLLEERGEVEVHCEFCNSRYVYDRVDAEALFAAADAVAPGATRH